MPKTLRLALVAAVAATICSPSLAASEHPPVRTERGTCIPGPHHPLRVRKLPGTPAMSDRHREPDEDAFVHCSEPPRPATPSRRIERRSGMTR